MYIYSHEEEDAIDEEDSEEGEPKQVLERVQSVLDMMGYRLATQQGTRLA